MNESPATEVDRKALERIEHLGMVPVKVDLPDWPYGSLNTILFAEAAAAFEELTLGHGVDRLRMQVPDAWPNIFRQSRFLSAVDLVQADRFRRMVALEMARLFERVDLLLVPSLRDEMLTISNQTGHPSLTLRAGFVEVGQARSDWAPDPAPIRLMRRSRVSSPSAAKMGAEPVTAARRPAALRRARDMALDVLHLLLPAFGVHAQRRRAVGLGDLVEAGLHPLEQGAARHVLQG